MKIKKVFIIFIMIFLSIMFTYKVNAAIYKGFNVVGTMEIPSINLKYPILEKVTKQSIETSIAFLYGAGINGVGNSVIIGHNYLNGEFFSNLKNVILGDKIYITDVFNKKIEYEVYNIFETTPEDTSFYQRDTDVAEVTLSTSTDDSQGRHIVFAKAVREVENLDENTNAQWNVEAEVDSGNGTENDNTIGGNNITGNNTIVNDNNDKLTDSNQNTNIMGYKTENALTLNKNDNTLTAKILPKAGKGFYYLLVIIPVIGIVLFFIRKRKYDIKK